MTEKFLDATTLIRLGSVDELELLTNGSGDLVVLPAVKSVVETEPARTNLPRFTEIHDIQDAGRAYEQQVSRAISVLVESARNGDVEIIAAVLACREQDRPVGVVSDGQRVRTTANAFGATVTETVGVVVCGVETGISKDDGLDIVERIDPRGLNMTGELRDKPETLIQAAAEEI